MKTTQKHRLATSPYPGCSKPCKIKTYNASQTLLPWSRTSHHYNPYVVYVAPRTLAPLYPLRRAIVPSTLRHCTPYIVPWHRAIGLPTPCHCTPYIAPLYPLHRTTVHPISYHCTPYIVPSHPIYRTIAPPLSWNCTCYIVPLRPLHRTIAPLYIVPLYPLRRTTAPLVPGVPASPYHCAVFTAPSRLHFAPPYLRLYALKIIIAPASRLPLRAVFLKFVKDTHIYIYLFI